MPGFLLLSPQPGNLLKKMNRVILELTLPYFPLSQRPHYFFACFVLAQHISRNAWGHSPGCRLLFQDVCGQTSPQGSYHDCKMPSAIIIRKFWETRFITHINQPQFFKWRNFKDGSLSLYLITRLAICLFQLAVLELEISVNQSFNEALALRKQL